MSRTGTSVFPSSFDSFDRIGTANYMDESGYDIVNVENEAMDAIEHIQAAIGTTAGTNVLKNAVAGQFVSFTAGTETLTNKTIDSPTLQGTYDGWIAANQTWTSLAGTAITPGVATTGRYSVGDRVKFTQGGSTIYNVITNVSGTVFVTNGGTGYVLGTTAITAPYYSHEASPNGYPTFFGYAPAWTALGTNQPAIGNGSALGVFSVCGGECSFSNRFVFGTSTTYGTGEYAFQVPLTASTCNDFSGAVWAVDNGSAYRVGAYYLNAGAGSVTVVSNAGALRWEKDTPHTWASTDIITFSGSYKI